MATGMPDAKPHRPRALAHLLGARPDPTWSFFEGVRRQRGCGGGGEVLVEVFEAGGAEDDDVDGSVVEQPAQ